MRILSLYEPYATLCVLGHKRFETRCWSTDYRGTIGIHATAKFPKWCKDLLGTRPFNQFYLNAKFPLASGAIIGTVDIVGMMKTEHWLRAYPTTDPRNRIEKAFGDYSKKRFAWELANPRRFAEPIPAKGFQRFWNYEVPEIEVEPLALPDGQLQLFY